MLTLEADPTAEVVVEEGGRPYRVFSGSTDLSPGLETLAISGLTMALTIGTPV